MLSVALLGSSMLIISAGLFFALTGAAWGWALVAFGVIDLAILPLVLRSIRRRAGANPYAREH